MASRKYTRSNLDPNPPTIVNDTYKIGRKYKKAAEKSSLAQEQSNEDFIPQVNSLLGRLETLQDIEFDIKFEQSLFHSKSLSWIDYTVVDSSISLHNPIEDLFSHNRSGS